MIGLRFNFKLHVMRKINLLLAFICFAITTITSAQTAPVKKAFEQKFPKAVNVKWSNENATEWQADFTIDKVKYSAAFTPQGIWLETIMVIKLSELPQVVRYTIEIQFPHWEITETNKTERAKDGVFYVVNLKKGRETKNLAFRENGTIID